MVKVDCGSDQKSEDCVVISNEERRGMFSSR